MIAGVISAVAGAVFIGLGLWLRRRQNAQKSRENSQPLSSTSRDLEHDPGFEPQEGTGFGTVVIIGDGGYPSPHREGPSHPPDAHAKAVAAMASDDEGIVSTSDPTAPLPARAAAAAPAAAVADPPQPVPSNPDQEVSPGKYPDPALGSGSAKDRAAEQSLTATMSTANMSTAEQVELGQFHERVASAAAVGVDDSTQGDAGDDEMALSASGQRGFNGSIGLGEAVLEAAENLAYHCQIPGVSEAAAVVSTLAKLVSDSRDIKSGGDSNLRKCRVIVRMLERASTVAGSVSSHGSRLCLCGPGCA